VSEAADLDLDAYLARIGHQAPVKPDEATLRALHEAHVGTIPFENLDVLLKQPIRLDLASVQAKLVAAGRGGYCFEHGALFAAVLAKIGFPVTTLAARVRMGSPGLMPRSHMLLKVEIAGRFFLADVGFGGQGLLEPMPMEAGAAAAGPGVRYRLAEEDAQLVLQGDFGKGWVDFYIFTQERQYPIDYEVSNHFTATHPSSRFVQILTAQLTRRHERLILKNRTLHVWRAPGEQRVTAKDDAALLALLKQHFGLSFPAGTRFPIPEPEKVS
jgi:N-hydroxyarylamine O-acetyltransferase